jgi:predicted DNA-binding transcriptional regulator AlpA
MYLILDIYSVGSIMVCIAFTMYRGNFMQDKLLNASEAARSLGVTPATVIRWFEAGKFPNAFRVDSTIRIPLSDVEALKQQGKKEAS